MLKTLTAFPKVPFKKFPLKISSTGDIFHICLLRKVLYLLNNWYVSVLRLMNGS